MNTEPEWTVISMSAGVQSFTVALLAAALLALLLTWDGTASAHDDPRCPEEVWWDSENGGVIWPGPGEHNHYIVDPETGETPLCNSGSTSQQSSEGGSGDGSGNGAGGASGESTVYDPPPPAPTPTPTPTPTPFPKVKPLDPDGIYCSGPSARLPPGTWRLVTEDKNLGLVQNYGDGSLIARGGGIFETSWLATYTACTVGYWPEKPEHYSIEKA